MRSARSINLPSHIRPLCELRTSCPQAPRPPTAKPSCWLQQSQKNVDHFWKKDTALVKALRQYHFTSGVLEGQTQWKFQKSRILHKVLDVIGLNMESTGRCLDFCDSMPVDQELLVSGHEPPMSEGRSGKRGGTLDYGPCVGRGPYALQRCLREYF